MKTSAEKSSSTASRTATQAASRPFFGKAGGSGFFEPVVGGVVSSLQLKMRVNQPGDKFEQEADRMADKVMRMPAPASPLKEDRLQRQADDRLQKKEKEEDKIQKAAMPGEKLQKSAVPEERIQKAGDKEIQKAEDEKVQKAEDERIQKAPAAEEKLQRKGNGVPTAGPSTQSAIQNQTTGGRPLSGEVRGFMEARFGADFGNVRIHSDPEAASLSNQLSARAFTYRNHVFFSRDQYQPGTSEGKQLLAHELTHTIQQGHAVQRSQQVTTTVTPPPVQRLGVQDALDYFADKAYNILGFRMLTIVLGFNPINMRSTDRSAANILRALIELVPGGHFITQALDNHGVFNKAGAWVEQKLAILGDIGSDIVAGLKRFLDSLSWTDIFHLGDLWDRAKRIFTDPISRLISFAGSVVSEILKMVKDAILKPLAALAQNTRGYDLLKAILGEDPITGEPVPRNADTLVDGFLKLIGQEEIWNNIKKGNAVARAWAWFQGALPGLMGFVRAIPRRVIDTITSLTFQDIVTVAGTFTKVVGAFVNIAGEFISWGLNQVISLLEILFSVVAPGVMPYIRKAQAAFVTILKNPIGFVGNLVRAGKMGFQLFAANIVTHLKTALIKWLVGPLAEAGVYIPKSFSLIEIVKLVLSVLGLTWQNIRSKLVKIIPEPVLVGLEKTAGILVTLVKDGPAAAWEQIKAELSELKDQLIAQVTQMISIEVVKAAVIKLVSMLNPAGAVVQAIIAIYNTITFFIQKISQIAAVVASFIDSIAAIAAGQVAGAAKKVEQTMANTLTVIIAFLAKFAGLGNIPEKLVGIIKKIRQPIDKGLDKIVAWLGKMLKKAAGAVLQAGVPKDPNERLRLAANAAVAAARRLTGRVTSTILQPVLGAIKLRYALSELVPFERGGNWWVRASVNPILERNLNIVTVAPSTPAAASSALQPMMPPVRIDFMCNTLKYVHSVYDAQVQGQAAGLNALSVTDWEKNIADYRNAGRGSAADQEAARQELRRDLASKGKTPDEIEAVLERMAALHEPDLVAGGRNWVTKLGSRYINSSIGSQWRTKWTLIREGVNAITPAADKPNRRINVTLTTVDFTP
ncbi:MAG: DUF4157 domain-containing protein [Nitrospira sp. LK70]|nr:DUF4157 domain-containing protein [Nitrospira sp. LK70]